MDQVGYRSEFGAAAAIARRIPIAVTADPIHGLIRKHKRAYAKQHRGYADEKASDLFEAEELALLALLTTRPTTILGVIALLDYIDRHGGHEDMGIFERTREDIADAATSFHGHVASSLRAISAS